MSLPPERAPASADARRAPEPVAQDDARIVALRRLLGIVDRLRAPDGCPWDREQTAASMAPHVVEEAHELLDAIETGGPEDVAEEAGDVIMAVALICRIESEAQRLDLARAAELVSDKLVRRHPHVFGDGEAETAGEVLSTWEAIKKEERRERDQDHSALAGVPRGLPALQRAARLCDKAVSAGFRWQDVAGALAKVHEEVAELEQVLPHAARAADHEPDLDADTRARVAQELGDVLLATAYLGRYLGVDPERACRDSARRFEARFRALESELEGGLGQRSPDELVAAWARAKDRLD